MCYDSKSDFFLFFFLRIFRLLTSFPQNFPLRHSAPFFLSLSLFVLSRYSHFHFGVKLKIPSSLLAGSCEKLSMRSSLSPLVEHWKITKTQKRKERNLLKKRGKHTNIFAHFGENFRPEWIEIRSRAVLLRLFFSLCWMRSKYKTHSESASSSEKKYFSETRTQQKRAVKMKNKKLILNSK